ncbi:heterokaryon incompatibility protein [Stemphylium lycopersici]|uniref:Heterokaryon incompatibility protein n=1 Tax=Stemphylium lycopersici TaxID=183478 RepID=A0A364NGV1_STELY|nr:heterokaryon incompatibility protein [Stemphylium lycopersici]
MSVLPFCYQTLSGPGQNRQIRLVTILPDAWGATLNLELEHAEITPTLKYECLSYAWGKNKHNRSITLNNSSFVISSTLYVALEHLRHPSQKRTIWIDAICINQADISERNAQVDMMGLIYHRAMRVVVWIGPATESSELAMGFLDMMATASTDRNPQIQFQGEDHVAREPEPGSRLGEVWHQHECFGNSPSTSHGHDKELETRCMDAKLGQRHQTSSSSQDSVYSGASSSEDKIDGSSQLCTFFKNTMILRIRSAAISIWGKLSGFFRDYAWISEIFMKRDIYHVVLLQEQYPQSKMLKAYMKLRLRLRELLRTEDYQNKTLRALMTPWYEIEVPGNIVQRTKNEFATRIPPDRNLLGQSRREYFSDKWESHWQALDELLARDWWRRTWVVQEVWNASEAVLQCGATTISWQKLQEAMDYSEGWDEMGHYVQMTKRYAKWDTLRRRYTLVIHLTTEKLNGGTLSSLLWNTWDRESTDPRDKVFAVLSLIWDQKDDLMRPDYGKPMDQVYRDAAREIIVKQGQIDILLAASGVGGDDTLPTWVPDWRCEANAKKPTLLVNRHLMLRLFAPYSMTHDMLIGHGYRAAGNSKTFALFSDDLRVLTVLGKRLGSIAEVLQADITGLTDDAFTDQAFEFLTRSKFVSTWTRWRESGRRERTTGSQNASILLTTLAGGEVEEEKWASTMRNTMRRRRLFTSQKGHIGIGSVDTQPGDDIFIISGCNFPIVLRPRDGKFAVVGEAYEATAMFHTVSCRPRALRVPITALEAET